MVREDLVRYVQQYSAQGYDIATLRDSLLQQGYAAQDIEEALQTVSGKKFPLIKVGFILGGIIIVLVAVLLIFGLTGEKAEIERPAYIPPEAPITPQEEIEEEIEAEVGEEIEDVPEIVEEIPEIPATPLTCPAQCNDYNICTRDLCIEGLCIFEEITPCCGNFQCEFGETEESCPDDCARERLTQEESTEVILAEAEKEVGMQKVYEAIKDLDQGNGVNTEDILQKLNAPQTEEIIQKLLREGELFEIAPGKLKIS